MSAREPAGSFDDRGVHAEVEKAVLQQCTPCPTRDGGAAEPASLTPPETPDAGAEEIALEPTGVSLRKEDGLLEVSQHGLHEAAREMEGEDGVLEPIDASLQKEDRFLDACEPGLEESDQGIEREDGALEPRDERADMSASERADPVGAPTDAATDLIGEVLTPEVVAAALDIAQRLGHPLSLIPLEMHGIGERKRIRALALTPQLMEALDSFAQGSTSGEHAPRPTNEDVQRACEVLMLKGAVKGRFLPEKPPASESDSSEEKDRDPELVWQFNVRAPWADRQVFKDIHEITKHGTHVDEALSAVITPEIASRCAWFGPMVEAKAAQMAEHLQREPAAAIEKLQEQNSRFQEQLAMMAEAVARAEERQENFVEVIQSLERDVELRDEELASQAKAAERAKATHLQLLDTIDSLKKENNALVESKQKAEKAAGQRLQQLRKEIQRLEIDSMFRTLRNGWDLAGWLGQLVIYMTVMMLAAVGCASLI